MTVKEYLEQAKDVRIQIQSKLEEIDNLRTFSTQVKTATRFDDKVQNQKTHDPIGSALAKVVDMESELISDIERLEQTQRQIKSVIEQVKTSEYRSILYKRYILEMTFEKIAVDMSYTYQWICILHGRALQEVEKIMTVDSN